jgi:hypothetical protein
MLRDCFAKRPWYGGPQLDAVDRDGKNAYSFAQDRIDAVEVKDLLDRSR